MADDSQIRLNIGIDNLKEFEKLNKIVPKLVKNFEKLGKATEKVSKARAPKSGGNSRPAGGIAASGNSRKKDIKERLSLFNLRISNKEIKSLQQAGAVFGSIKNQINALRRSLDKQGKSTRQADILTQKATKSFRRAKKQIISQKKAQDSLSKSQQKNISVQKRSLNLQSKINKSRNRFQKLATSGRGFSRGRGGQRSVGGLGPGGSSGVDTSSAFLLQNAGFLIQDAPFGIRGVANNISAVSRGFQLLNQRVSESNKKLGTSLTTFGALKKTLKGPTGMFLLVGSLLPAALEIGQQAFNKFAKSGKKDLEDVKEKLQELVDFRREVSGFDEDLDLFGIRKATKDIENLEPLLNDLQKLADSRDTSKNIQSSIISSGRTSRFGFQSDVDELITDSKSDVQFNKLGLERLLEAGFTKKDIQDKVDKIRKNKAFSEFIRFRDKTAQLDFRQRERIAGPAKTVSSFNKIEEDLDKLPDNFKSDLSDAKKRLKDLKQELIGRSIEFRSRGAFDLVRVTFGNIARINNFLGKKEDEGIPNETPDVDIIDPISNLGLFEANIQRGLLGVDANTDQFNRDIQSTNRGAQRNAGDIVGTLRNNAGQQLESIERNRFGNVRDLINQRSRRAVSAARQRASLKTASTSASSLDKRIDIINNKNKAIKEQRKAIEELDPVKNAEAIAKREQNIKTIEENARKKLLKERQQTNNELQKIEKEKEDKITDIQEKANQEQLENKRQKEERLKQIDQQRINAQTELFSLSTQTAIDSLETIQNFTESSSRAIFAVQKALAVSQAVMNARQAFTKASAQTGILAKPLAFAVLASNLAQAGLIASRSFSDRVGGGGGSSGGSAGVFRGFGSFSDDSFSTAFFGEERQSNRQNRNNTFPDTFVTFFKDGGSGDIVTKGTTELLNDNNSDLDFWQSPGGN